MSLPKRQPHSETIIFINYMYLLLSVLALPPPHLSPIKNDWAPHIQARQTYPQHPLPSATSPLLKSLSAPSPSSPRSTAIPSRSRVHRRSTTVYHPQLLPSRRRCRHHRLKLPPHRSPSASTTQEASSSAQYATRVASLPGSPLYRTLRHHLYTVCTSSELWIETSASAAAGLCPKGPALRALLRFLTSRLPRQNPTPFP